jgi:hypothetical protein
MNGHIVSGLGAASRLIELQKPLLRDFLPDIEDCKIGTINVQLDHTPDIRIPDIVTPPLQWEPDFERRRAIWIYQRQARIVREAA